jgi:hypothetical protein
MKRILMTIAAFTLLTGSAPRILSAQPWSMDMYQQRGPTPGADPGQRHRETFRVPLRLQIEARDGSICVGNDSSSVVEISIDVGKLMTVGIASSLFYFQGAEREKFGGGSLCNGYHAGRMCRPDLELTALAAAQGFVQFLEEMTVFETDLPSQHMWQPEKGRYRVLWRGVAVGTYRPK